jgi:hypothetical protein
MLETVASCTRGRAKQSRDLLGCPRNLSKSIPGVLVLRSRFPLPLSASPCGVAVRPTMSCMERILFPRIIPQQAMGCGDLRNPKQSGLAFVVPFSHGHGKHENSRRSVVHEMGHAMERQGTCKIYRLCRWSPLRYAVPRFKKHKVVSVDSPCGCYCGCGHLWRRHVAQCATSTVTRLYSLPML